MSALPEDSVDALTALAGVALHTERLDDTLREICIIAVRAVPGAEGASLTTLSERGPEAVASSDGWAQTLDETQYEEREGPCLDAARTGLAFRVRDLEAESRWPSYTPRAVEMGARSLVSMPMAGESKIVGALNIYARVPDAFDSTASSIAEIVAAHASLASQVAAALFGHKELAEHLRAALQSRAPIEQAKGIIMATVGCDAGTAFQTLVQQSQHENRKLRDVAQALVDRYGGDAPA